MQQNFIRFTNRQAEHEKSLHNIKRRKIARVANIGSNAYKIAQKTSFKRKVIKAVDINLYSQASIQKTTTISGKDSLFAARKFVPWRYEMSMTVLPASDG